MPKEKKAGKVTAEKRVLVVMEMILLGFTRAEIIQNVSNPAKPELYWKLDPRQVDNYIFDAKERIEKEIDKDRDKLIMKAHSRYNFIYKKLMNVKDYKAALLAVEKEATLLGLNAPKAVDVTSNGEVIKAPIINVIGTAGNQSE